MKTSTFQIHAAILKFIPAGLCLALSFLAGPAGAVTLQYWDNQGTGTPTGGIFDTNTANWAPSGTLTTGTAVFTNGNFPIFTAGGTSAGTIIVTNNTPNLAIAGLNNNGVSGSSCTLALNGTGSFYLEPGTDQIYISSGANTTFNVPLNGPGGIIENGSGNLYLYATNTYSGGTTTTGGQLLYYNNPASFGTGPITFTGSQSILTTNASVVTITNAWIMNNAGGIINFASGNTTCTGPWTLMTSPQIKNNGGSSTVVTLSGPISGAFGVYYQCPNAAKIVLSGPNTYTGVSYIGYSPGTSPENVSVSSINSVTAPPQQSSSSLGVPSSVANGTIGIGYGSTAAALIYTGPGETSDRVISLFGTTGGAIIEMDGAGPLVLTSSFLAPTNGAKTLTLQGTSTTMNTIRGAIPNSGSGATALTKAQAGTWVLAGTNTFSGNTTVSGGMLIINGAGKLNSGSYAGTIANSGTFIYNSSASQTLSGVISGAGTLTEAGAGTLILSGANTYSGNTTNSGGVLQVAHADVPGTSGPLGKATAAGSILMNGGTLQYVAANGANDYSSRFSTVAGQVYNIDVNGQAVAFGTGLSSSTGKLTLSSTAAGGSLTLNAPATYGGLTTINSGTLIIGSSGSLGSGGVYAPNIIDNGGLTYGGSSAQTLSGTFTGTGALTENGPGSLTLSSATVNYSGATTIGAASTLYLTASAPTNYTSSLNIGAGGTLDVSAISSSVYTITNITSLTAAGSSSAAAMINGASGEVINLGSQPLSLTISPTTFNGATQPALVIPQSMAINGNIIAVNNASGTPLGAGNYVLIQVGGTLTGTPNQYVTVTGAGLVGGDFATVQVSGGNVILSVHQPPNSNPTWTGNDYANFQTWSDSANWLSGVPDAIGDSVNFNNGSSQTPVMDSSYAVYSLTFLPGTASDVLTNSGGSVLTVGSGVTNNSGNPQTLALPVQLVDLGGPLVPSQWDTTGGNITASGVISDNNIGLNVSGGNMLTLSGLNTYTGGTTINGATLDANTVADAASSIGTGTLALAGGGTFSFTSPAGTTTRTVAVEGSTTDIINVPTNSTLTLNGQVHSVSDTAPQMLTLTGGGTLNLGGTPDNSGLTMAINQGTVVITKTSASTAHGLGSGSTIVGTGTIGNTAELQLAGSGGFDLYSGCAITLQEPDGFFDLGGQSDTFNTLTNNNDTVGAIINSSSTNSTINPSANGLVMNVNTTIGGGASIGPITISSKIVGPYSLTQAGPGLLTLGGASTYNGGLNINAGTAVTLTAAAAGGTGTIAINGNGVLTFNAAATYANAITGGSTSLINVNEPSGNTFLTGSLTGFTGTIICNSANGGSGQCIINNANNAGNPIDPSATWIVTNGATIDLATPYVTDTASVILYGTGNNQAYGSFRLDACNQTGNVVLKGNTTIGNGNAGQSTISGVISDNGQGYGFTLVTGLSTGGGLALTASNTYSGATAVNSRTLFLSGSGSIANSSSISLANGTTFDVSGVSAGTYFLGAGQTLATLGGSATNNGNLDVSAGSPLLFRYTTTNSIPLNVTSGTLNLNNNPITVSNATGHALGAGTYTMIRQTAGSISGTPNPAVTMTGSGVAAGTTSSLVVSGGNLNLVVTALPLINSVTTAGGNIVFGGTNVPASGTFIVLTSTNLTAPFNQWTPLSTNSFNGTGTFSVTNNIGGNLSSFFIIEIPN